MFLCIEKMFLWEISCPPSPDVCELRFRFIYENMTKIKEADCFLKLFYKIYFFKHLIYLCQLCGDMVRFSV